MKQKITQMRLGRYLFTALLTLLFVSCGKSSSSEPTPSPQPEPGGYTPPKSHIYKDEKSSPVAEVRSDGTVVYEANTAASELPKVGEIIVSGVTDAAPQGFIYKVESVTMKDGKAEVKTSPAFINDVIKDYNGVIPVDLSNAEIDSVFDEEGNPVDINTVKVKKSGARAAKVGTFSVELSKDIYFDRHSKRNKLTGKKDDIKSAGKVELKVSAEMGLNFVCNVSDWQIQQFGAEASLEYSATAKLKVGGSFSSSAGYEENRVTNKRDKKKLDEENGVQQRYKLGEIKLKPITVLVWGVPIVVTPKTEIHYIGSLNASAKVEMTLLEIKGGGSMSAVWTKDIDVRTGKHWKLDSKFDNPFENFGKTLFDPFKKLESAKLGLSLEASAAVRTGINLSFFNLNENANVAPYAEMGVKFKGELEFSPKQPTLLSKDAVSGSFYVAAGAEAKLKFNVLKKKFAAELDQKVTLLEADLWTPFSLTPEFNDIQIYPEDEAGIMKRDSLKFKAAVNYPSISILPITDYGFCYSQFDYEYNDPTAQYVSLNGKYNLSVTGFVNKPMEASIPTSNLVPNKTYNVWPYVKIFGITFLKKGIKFKTGDARAGKAMTPIIKGEDLFTRQ